MMHLTITRRQLLKTVGALGATASLPMMSRVACAAPGPDMSDYKALVCVFLYGGNNGFNWFVPKTDINSSNGYGYNKYAASRGSGTAVSLALDRNSLLDLNGTGSDGNTYGIHPSCPELQALFNDGNAAILCNVGTLVKPVSVQNARGGKDVPPQLFSHVDQFNQWMTSNPASMEKVGWAGRIADYYGGLGKKANLSFNVDVGGANSWQDGANSSPYVLGSGAPPTMDLVFNGSTDARNGTRKAVFDALLGLADNDPNQLLKAYGKVQHNADSKFGIIKGAFDNAGTLVPAIPTTLSELGAGDGQNELGIQLSQVALTIKGRSAIGDSRQLFFVSLGGFDTHNGELSGQAGLLKIVSKNLGAFWQALKGMGMEDKVAIFINTDFGRTLTSNGDGSDHAWGNHSMVIGGGMKTKATGGKYYGDMPALDARSSAGVANILDSAGRIVPTTATEQYAATLAKWFGIPDADLDRIFPNLSSFGGNLHSNFASGRDMGFLG